MSMHMHCKNFIVGGSDSISAQQVSRIPEQGEVTELTAFESPVCQ